MGEPFMMKKGRTKTLERSDKQGGTGGGLYTGSNPMKQNAIRVITNTGPLVEYLKYHSLTDCGNIILTGNTDLIDSIDIYTQHYLDQL
eukprot:15349172-Ditylum_brightwellii.AAC.1